MEIVNRLLGQGKAALVAKEERIGAVKYTAIGDLDSGGENEIIIGTDAGVVIAFTPSGKQLWRYECPEEVTLTIGNGSGFIGSTGNVIDVSLNNPSERVKAINLNICDEEDYLTCTGCETTIRSLDFSCVATEHGDGCVEIALFNLKDALIEEGEGPIVTLNCDVSSSAPPGECRDLNPENAEVANELNIPIDVILEPGEFCFLSHGTIIIDGCDTEVMDKEIEEGLTMSDLIFECADDAKNHGMFVSCVAKRTNQWKKERLISGKEKGAIQKCAAQSNNP